MLHLLQSVICCVIFKFILFGNSGSCHIL